MHLASGKPRRPPSSISPARKSSFKPNRARFVNRLRSPLPQSRHQWRLIDYTDRVKNQPSLLIPVASLLLTGLCPSAFAQSATGPTLLVANQTDRNVSFIDGSSPAAAHQIATVPEDGITGHELAVYPPNHTLFVPIYGNSGVGKPGTDGSTLDVIDLATRKITGTINFGHAARPHCPVYDPNSKMMYVTTELDKSIAVIDPRTLKIVGSVPTGQAESHMLTLSRDGKRGYTANVGPGTVSVLDMAARKTVTIIPISGTTQRISISRDDSMVFTSDQTKPQLAVIDTASNKVKAWVPLPSLGYGTASTKDGHWLIVAMPAADQVAVVDLTTLKVAQTVAVGKHPSEVLVTPDGATAYVACQGGAQVAAIDIKQWKTVATIAAGKGSDGLAWAQ
jgi:YVTN family beta-propeller protein